MLLNSKLFSQIDFFLGSKQIVKTLEAGAKKFGGATKINNTIYSNIEADNNIKVNAGNNTISLFIPSTIDADQTTDNSEYVNTYYGQIKKHFKNSNIVIHSTSGAWYSEDMNKVIIEDITIIEAVTSELTQNDINFMLNLGLEVKRVMSQESVSVCINSSLCLV